MKEYTRLIGNITALGFVLIVAVGYFMFLEMNTALQLHQLHQFQTESRAKIAIFNERINNISNNFNSYAKLPSFKSIRFHTLTLNYLAADEDKRQLELFLFDAQKDNIHLIETRFIDNEGVEIIKVDQTAIYSNLENVSNDKNVLHLISLNLKADENHIDAITNDSGTLVSVIWWVPVYVSSTKRLGYLAFNVNSTLITREITDIADSGQNFIIINNQFDNLSRSEYLLISEPLLENIKLDDVDWIVSDELPLSGLNWRISIVGNKNLYTEGIETTKLIVNYGLIPASILIFIFLAYIYRKKIAADKHIHHLAFYDSLTGLVNRHQFDNALNNALIETKEHNSQHALLYLDLDQFKIVNDTCGHLAGDKLLEELAAYLKKTVRDIDMLARLGGDEFALLLNLCPENMAINIANKILTTVSDFRFVWKEKSFSIGVSIGVVFIN
ncbi:MAG: GGDEF domain-containing protein, partial [Gammaproteobacteria bacterium]|nr:GGDEF domain-containing protein [Gammaproteobacteria bacterium]